MTYPRKSLISIKETPYYHCVYDVRGYGASMNTPATSERTGPGSPWANCVQ